MALSDGSELFSSAGNTSLGPAALDHPALMLRWRVSHEEQRLGLMPGPPVERSETLVSVIFPLPTPLALNEKSRIDFAPDESESFSFDPDLDAMVERIGEILLRSEDVVSETLIDAHRSASFALGRESFLVAFCPEDVREAQYLVLPTQSVARLVDSGAFCRKAFDRFE